MNKKNTKSTITSVLFLMIFVLTGCSSNTSVDTTEVAENKEQENKVTKQVEESIVTEDVGMIEDTASLNQDQKKDAGKKIIDLNEIAKHNTKKDCWTAIESRVFDITGYIALEKHKPSITKACGIDATEMMTKHKNPEKTKEILDGYYIGDLK